MCLQTSLTVYTLRPRHIRIPMPNRCCPNTSVCMNGHSSDHGRRSQRRCRWPRLSNRWLLAALLARSVNGRMLDQIVASNPALNTGRRQPALPVAD